MKIYWMFLVLSLIMCLWCNTKYDVIRINGQYEKMARWSQAIVFFGVIIFFCGLRSGVADSLLSSKLQKNMSEKWLLFKKATFSDCIEGSFL